MARSNPIRILHVITSLGRGGAERQLLNLVSNTDRTRFEHTVAFLRRPDDFVAELESAGYRTICLDVRGPVPWLNAARKIQQLIKTRKPTLLHSWLYDANVSARLAALFSPTIPLAVSVQNPDYEPELTQTLGVSRAKIGMLKYIDRISARWLSPTFVACSEFALESTVKHLKVPPANIEVIYNAVDTERLAATENEIRDLRASLRIPPQAFVFLNVGRLDPQKGQAFLIRSFRKIAQSIPNAYLLILGQGPLQQELIELSIKLEIADRVSFLGIRTDVGACLSLADVFVFPSLFEGLPLALVEAMSKGLPCVVTTSPIFHEVINGGDAGLAVTPGSVDELAGAMFELYRNPGMRIRLGNRAREEVKRRFDINTTIHQWERLYSRVAGIG